MGSSSEARIATSATIVAPKLTPLMMNTQPGPTPAISRPARPGPISRAPVNDALLSPTAFGRPSGGTSCATNVCRAGASNALATPRRRANP